MPSPRPFFLTNFLQASPALLRLGIPRTIYMFAALRFLLTLGRPSSASEEEKREARLERLCSLLPSFSLIFGPDSPPIVTGDIVEASSLPPSLPAVLLSPRPPLSFSSDFSPPPPPPAPPSSPAPYLHTLLTSPALSLPPCLDSFPYPPSSPPLLSSSPPPPSL